MCSKFSEFSRKTPSLRWSAPLSHTQPSTATETQPRSLRQPTSKVKKITNLSAMSVQSLNFIDALGQLRSSSPVPSTVKDTVHQKTLVKCSENGTKISNILKTVLLFLNFRRIM